MIVFYYLFQKLRREIESEKERSAEATSALDRERMRVTTLQRELEVEREKHHATDVKYKSKVSELKSSVESEKTRNDELNTYVKVFRSFNLFPLMISVCVNTICSPARSLS